MKISFFVYLFFFSSPHITQNLYGILKYYTYQMTALKMQIISTCLELRVNYDWQATASKLSPEHNAVSFWCFFGFLHNHCMYTGRVTYSQATPRLLNACVTGCDEFGANYSCVCVSSSPLLFSLLAYSTWRMFSPAENAIVHSLLVLH